MKNIDYVMMQTARNFATLSSAQRKKVGAVLSKDGRIVTCGYNGTIAGKANVCEKKCPQCKGDKVSPVDRDIATICSRCDGQGIITNEFVLHAEQNILTFCNKEGLSTKGCEIYVTMAPCKTCSKLLASAGIKKVFYFEEYRDFGGIDFLKELKIPVIQLKDLK